MSILIQRLFGIPTVFTLNNDGMNDALKFVLRDMELYDLKVYNRWEFHVRIYLSIKIGTGGNASDGTYMYILAYKKLWGDKQTVVKKGTITLLRYLVKYNHNIFYSFSFRPFI